MKAQKLITLDVKLIELLKQEQNASLLINRLLEDYFKYTKGDVDALKYQLEKIESEVEHKLTKKEEISNRITGIQEVQQKQEEDLRTAEQKKQDKENQFRDNFIDNFQTFGGRDPTEEEFEEWKILWNSGSNCDVITFVREKTENDETG